MYKRKLQIKNSISRLIDWFDGNGHEGWDPYDVQDSKLFRIVEKRFPNIIGKILIRLFSEFAHIFPISFRKIAGVEKAINNKGLGLMLAAYSSYYACTKNPKFLEKAIALAKTLKRNSSVGYTGISWGYPFDWLSPILIPAGVPSSVVTSIVGDGFYRLFKATGDREHLKICEDVCLFFLENLHITFQSSDQMIRCYSYTPLDDYQVHNANLFIAEFLIRIGNETKNESFVAIGLSCARFALSEQQKEGYLPYWGLSQTDKYSGGRLHTDHYHCGFEIRSLKAIWEHTNIDAFKKSYCSYYAWYKESLFDENAFPKYTTHNLYPLNIHTCAEAILCNTKLANSDQDINFVLGVALDVVEKMEYSPGEYTHVIREVLPRVKIKSNIPLLRWGQAWMLLALVELYRQLEDDT
jgi:hypothetical protein